MLIHSSYLAYCVAIYFFLSKIIILCRMAYKEVSFRISAKIFAKSAKIFMGCKYSFVFDSCKFYPLISFLQKDNAIFDLTQRGLF